MSAYMETRVGTQFMSDREVEWSAAMRAANRGDAAAYQALLKSIAGVLRHVVRRRLARSGLGAHECDDIVQEALLAIHEKRSTWDESRPILPWVHAIARYKMIDATRRLARLRRHVVDMPDEDWLERQPAALAHADRASADIAAGLKALTERQRAVVLAITRDGATIRSAAERLSMTEGAVRTMWHRSLARLRTLSDEETVVCAR